MLDLVKERLKYDPCTLTKQELTTIVASVDDLLLNARRKGKAEEKIREQRLKTLKTVLDLIVRRQENL